MMCVKEPYGKLSINIICLLWFSIEQHSIWSLDLFCYRSHSALIKLHLSPCSAQRIMLCTDALKREICRLVVSIHRCSHLTGLESLLDLPFPIVLSRIIPLWNSILSSEVWTLRAAQSPLCFFYSIGFHDTGSSLIVLPFVSFMDSFFPH